MPLLLVTLLLAATPAFAQAPIPTLLLPEQAVAEPAIQPIPGGAPDGIATDGTNFLVDSTAIVKFNAYGRWVMLVDGHARPLLKTSIELGPSAWAGAGAAWSGHEYLVLWGNAGGYTNGVRIDREGNLLDRAPLSFPGADTIGFPGVLVWDGGQFVAVRSSSSGLVAMRISESGELLQSGIRVSNSGFVAVAAAAANGVSVIVWSDSSGSHYRTINAAGILGAITDISTSFASIDAAAGADGFLLRIASKTGTILQHLSPGGEADAPPFSLPVIRLVSAGRNYLVLLAAPDGSTQSVRINGSGAFVDEPRTIPPLPANRGPIAATESDAIVTWWVDGPTTYDPATTFGREVDSSDAVQIHRGYLPQQSPRVVWRGNDAVVSWTEDVIREQRIGDANARTISGRGDIDVAVASGPDVTMHVMQRGTPATPTKQAQYALYALIGGGDPVLLDSATAAYLYTARVVWTGRDFIAVWLRPGTAEIYGARVSTAGQIVNGPTAIASVENVYDIALGALNGNVLVVWKDRALARAVVLTPAGELPADDVTTLDELQYQATSFSVATDGQDLLVTWINKSHNSYPPNDWMAGKLFDANGRALTPLLGNSPGSDTKTIAATFWTGSGFLTLWSALRVWNAFPETLFAVRNGADGRLLDYPPVRIGDVDGIDGEVTSIARGPGGQIAIAYVRDRRAYTRFIVFPRERSVHR